MKVIESSPQSRDKSFPPGYSETEIDFQSFFTNLPVVKPHIKGGQKHKRKKGLEIENKPFLPFVSSYIKHHTVRFDLIPGERLKLR